MQKSLSAGSGAGPANERRARAALSLAALATAGAGVPAVVSSRGSPTTRFEQVDGGAGGSTSSTGHHDPPAPRAPAGTGGTGGSAPKPPGWPDSPTAALSLDGTTEIPCPTGDKAPSHGQDGDHRLNVPHLRGGRRGRPLGDLIDHRSDLAQHAALPDGPHQEAFCASQKFANLDGSAAPHPDRAPQPRRLRRSRGPHRSPRLSQGSEARLWTSTEHLVGEPPGTNFWTVDSAAPRSPAGPPGTARGTPTARWTDTPLASLCCPAAPP